MNIRSIYHIAAIALITLVGCNKEPRETIFADPDYANVTLSSTSTTMTSEGGNKELFVATNRDTWEATTDADWVDISIEGLSLTLYVDANTTGEERLAVINITAGTKPDTAVARFKLLQLGDKATDLSAAGTANCYIASTNATFSLRADIRGNGADDGNTRYMAEYGSMIKGGSYAELIWEATFDGDKTRSTHIIDGTPFYSADEGRIYLTTGESEGNALVALCDGSGCILWSWHLWVSNNAVTTVTSNGLEWMDRNLGALNNDPDDIANRGMLYQWGRKEPFLPSSVEYMEVPTHSYDENYELLESEEEYYAIQAEIEAMRSVLNINNTQRGDGSYEWTYVGLEAPVALNAPGNIDYALNHPTTILGCRTDIPIGEYLFDWYLQQNLVNSNGVMMQAYSELWGSAEMGTDYKTIFDPCPPGYCVPPSGAFGTLPKEYACTYLSRDWRKEAYGWTWLDGENYFPAAGNLDVSGLMGETSERMLYWTAESDNEAMTSLGKSATLFVAYNDIYYGIYPLLDGTVPASWYSYGARAYAASVRCVRETHNNN